jgi:hypothetical protein
MTAVGVPKFSMTPVAASSAATINAWRNKARDMGLPYGEFD